ncbi:hypothetical protein FGW20_06560 [Methanoculleus sp. FWC-SCC3]|uniref:Uncharacterized protein n=1 Tax=Methanoculleus methanifontis TaxID=2584086 RepID=A0ABT8M0Y7_9EURY|nr:hypothetical protein [Methanoculleus sp. FWC-SCC3]MDN7012705.1 hypothetical protein [Methanoculleus sp. FWC-SCC3]
MLSVLFIAVLVTMPAFAHVPLFARGGSSPDPALVVEDPAKPWVIYDTPPRGTTGSGWRRGSVSP